MPVAWDYEPRHVVQLRIKPRVWAWILAQSVEAGLAPSTYIHRRMEQDAIRDVQKGVQDERQD